MVAASTVSDLMKPPRSPRGTGKLFLKQHVRRRLRARPPKYLHVQIDCACHPTVLSFRTQPPKTTSVGCRTAKKIEAVKAQSASPLDEPLTDGPAWSHVVREIPIVNTEARIGRQSALSPCMLFPPSFAKLTGPAHSTGLFHEQK